MLVVSPIGNATLIFWPALIHMEHPRNDGFSMLFKDGLLQRKSSNLVLLRYLGAEILLETKNRSSVDGNEFFVEESAVIISKLRADFTNSEGEPHLEQIGFFCGIPKFGSLLLAKRESIYDCHAASIGEANLLVASCCSRHLDECGGLVLCFRA